MTIVVTFEANLLRTDCKPAQWNVLRLALKLLISKISTF